MRKVLFSSYRLKKSGFEKLSYFLRSYSWEVVKSYPDPHDFQSSCCLSLYYITNLQNTYYFPFHSPNPQFFNTGDPSYIVEEIILI